MNDTSTIQEHSAEVSAGERFEFGKNWARFLATLTPEKIVKAEVSLRQGLRRESLAGLEFLDIGSGSGLFSLAARRLGARVTSMDYDPYSVSCTQELRRRYFPDDPDWKVLSGSVLDASFMRSLGSSILFIHGEFSIIPVVCGKPWKTPRLTLNCRGNCLLQSTTIRVLPAEDGPASRNSTIATRG